jgi:hypothetical protein
LAVPLLGARFSSLNHGQLGLSGLGQGAHQRDDLLLVSTMREGHEVAHEFQQQPLLLRRPERVVPAYPIEKVADVDAEHLRRLVEPASGHAVDAR